jgi:protein-S-isoprenylcysteine O-methyltransferase Ste14
MSNGLVFVILVIVFFVVFATQAGKEGGFLHSWFACIAYLVIAGVILWAVAGGHMAVLK